MAPKAPSLLFCFFLILIAIPFFTHASSSSPFEFINQLRGCQKGKTVKDLHKLKSYLQRFGYLNNQNTTNDDDFDDNLEAALKTYQLNYHLNATGVLDTDTASKMMMPRCGVPDITNGTNHMQTGKKPHHHGNRKSLHTVSHFQFFSGNPKWSKSHLTYGFYQNVKPNVISAVGRAFDKWASASQYFSFSRVEDAQTADLKIGFERGNHGDGKINEFDGRGATLAHASPPTDGRFHYDLDETWSVGPVAGAFDLETVAIHEIGHLLGLDHSNVQDAIMFPSIPIASTKGLNADDIQGIKTLYNV